MPNWHGSTRQFRRPSNWFSEIRPRILERDQHRCQWVRTDNGLRCGLPANEVDHIVPNDDHSDGNLRALCDWHHRKKSGHEGGIASGKARRARRDDKKPLHPGLLDKPIDRTPPPF